MKKVSDESVLFCRIPKDLRLKILRVAKFNHLSLKDVVYLVLRDFTEGRLSSLRLGDKDGK